MGCPTKKIYEKFPHVGELRMLRCMFDVTKIDELIKRASKRNISKLLLIVTKITARRI